MIQWIATSFVLLFNLLLVQSTTNVTSFNNTSSSNETVFLVAGDYPYNEKAFLKLSSHIDEMNGEEYSTKPSFFVHVGDITRPSVSKCSNEWFSRVAEILKQSSIPVFVTLGDNDYIDCPDPEEALKLWRSHFEYFDSEHWNHTLQVEYQENRPENLAFFEKGVLYIMIHIIGPPEEGGIDKEEWASRHLDNIHFVEKKIREQIIMQRNLEKVILFGHARPRSVHDDFFDPLESIAKEFSSSLPHNIPFVYIHGDGHVYENTRFLSNTVARIQVTEGEFEGPLLCTVSKDDIEVQRENGETARLSRVSTSLPTSIPTLHPTTKPTMKPTLKPTTKPTLSPTTKPTSKPTVLSDLKRCDFNTDSIKDPTCEGTLTPDMTGKERRINAGEFICSPNKKYSFGITHDGYLAICRGNKKVWKEGPFANNAVRYVQFQRDGNLVLHGKNEILYHSGSHGNYNSVLTLQDDGTVTIKSQKDKVVWEKAPVENLPTQPPTNFPIAVPLPTITPTHYTPTTSPRPSPTSASPTKESEYFIPGLLTVNENGILLSRGLKSRVIAEKGKPVMYSNGKMSDINFHANPDGASVFAPQESDYKNDNFNKEIAWVYVSNSELDGRMGGVGAIQFDKHGNILDYRMVLTGTNNNCSGGRSPWNTWISCEEIGGTKGQIYEVDPFGRYQSNMTALGGKGGNFESVAVDNRNEKKPVFFVTNDRWLGEIRRYRPDPQLVLDSMENGEEYKILTTPMDSEDYPESQMDYLVLRPSSRTFYWTKNIERGRSSAENHFQNCEGIESYDGMLYFVSKEQHEMFALDLDEGTYTKESTNDGLFKNSPDQIVRLLDDEEKEEKGEKEESYLFFTEEGGSGKAGIYIRDSQGNYVAIVKTFTGESSGLAFSPDRRFMYFSEYEEGRIIEVSRLDGKPFSGKSMNLRHHDVM